MFLGRYAVALIYRNQIVRPMAGNFFQRQMHEIRDFGSLRMKSKSVNCVNNLRPAAASQIPENVSRQKRCNWRVYVNKIVIIPLNDRLNLPGCTEKIPKRPALSRPCNVKRGIKGVKALGVFRSAVCRSIYLPAHAPEMPSVRQEETSQRDGDRTYYEKLRHPISRHLLRLFYPRSLEGHSWG